MSNSINQTIKLLWTGGWDSTYRLCEILLLLKKPVQPIYLIDENRNSTREELLAQSHIKHTLFSKFPFTQSLLYNPEYYCVSDLRFDNYIKKNYLTVKKQIGLGTQYEWLANFCNQNNISNLELGFEKTIGSKKHDFLKQYLTKRTGIDYESFVLNQKYKGEPFYELLKFYDWPIWLKTRNEMVDIAKANEFNDILHLSWFCHNPIKGKPCGRCNPCKDIIWFGFNYRLPRSAKIRYYTRFLSKSQLKKFISPNF
ncbi:hypothetical protein [Saccharicrinis sp. FJH54]|uniref:hypothetical protein n=1 Tax=Saccharicrinis sp. FJH54 TaxID=3344665 RepID=UPI0035D47474